MAPSDRETPSNSVHSGGESGQDRPKFHHPGAGRRRARLHPKGRQVDPVSLEEIQVLLGDRSRQRDLLIEHLHLLQDQFGALYPRHIAALAEDMRVAMAEVYEVATFYAHFDVVDGDVTEADGPPVVTVRVCESLCCAMSGGEELLAELQEQYGDRARVVAAPCMGGCDAAPVVSVGQHQVAGATPKSVDDAVVAHAGKKPPHMPSFRNLAAYKADGGYRLLDACRAGSYTPEAAIELLQTANLRGMGGAFFPTARKWGLVRAQAGPKIVAINADEGEVGTFKDRHFLETDPHAVIEGMLVAAWAVEAHDVYFYLRDEYAAARAILEQELAALGAAGVIGKDVAVHLRRGAGAYICGEESAMIESIEGKRGLPRHRPPYVAEVGVFGRPTLVNNVETMYWARQILSAGLVDQKPIGEHELRAYSVSGRVKQPGVKLAPIGISVQSLIDEYCGGMADGHIFAAFLPGGASGGILPASLADVPLEGEALARYDCFVGSAAIVVLSDRDNVADAALNLMKFFEHESCGQCSPCRVGTAKAVQLMETKNWDIDLLRDLSDVMRDASICGLGQAAPNPLDCVLNHMPESVPGRS